MLPPFIDTVLVAALLAVLVFNMSQRRHLHHGEGKRMASLYTALLLLVLYAASIAIERWRLSPWTMLAGIAAAAALGYILRSRIFVFRRTCAECGAGLPLKTTLYVDDNLCDRCRSGNNWPYESSTRMDPNSVPATAAEVDWENWEPSETAVLCYVISDGQVLLINKKTGLGKGMVNAPGGRLEEDEAPREAAVRELEEEVGITPKELHEVARLSFIFTNGFSLSGTVFLARGYSGEMRETDEAAPFWAPVDEIPYHNMWEDDRYWLPRVLAGNYVEGRFIFEDEKMLSKQITERPLAEAADPYPPGHTVH